MTVVVTGGAGYVGALVVDELLDSGRDVRVLDVLLHGQEDVAKDLGALGVELIRGDIRDAEARRARARGRRRGGAPRRDRRRPRLRARPRALERRQRRGQPRAGRRRPRSGRGAPRVRLDLLELRPHGRPDGADRPRRASCARCRSTPSRRSRSRTPCSAPATATATRCAPPACASRPSTASAPRMRFDLTVNEFTRDLWADRHLEVFGEQFWRPYVHVRDAARAVRTVLDAPPRPVAGEVFNVGRSGENYRKLDLVELIPAQHRHGRGRATSAATRTRATTRSPSRRSARSSASRRR